jgi:metal-responsive CopG/Arc/MetJ family transcriptional regulator
MTKKIATSLPEEQYEAVERLRRRLRLKRSQAVQEALSMWLAAHQRDERLEQYLRGYVNQPEDAAEARGYVRAWAKEIESEDW